METQRSGAGASGGGAQLVEPEPRVQARASERPGARTVRVRVTVVLSLIALDLWSKSAVFTLLASSPEGMSIDRCRHLRLPLVGEWLAFMHSLNRGMAWGFDKLPVLVLVGGRIAAVIFLFVLVVRTPARARLLAAALVLILAGAAGNLADNLFLGPKDGATFGAVRDFIDVYFERWSWHFPTFNVADACISVGAVLLVLSSLRGSHDRDRPATGAGAAG